MGKLKSLTPKPASGHSQKFYINNNHITLNFMKLKNYYQLLFFAFVLLFAVQSCVKQGPIGLTGANGTDGADGKDANTACLKCHTTSVMEQKKVEYQFSKHFYGTSSARNTKYCARCHTSDGFKEITANGKFVVANDIPAAERINCSTCHTHSAFDFTGDTATYILRTTSPIALNYLNNDLTKKQDFGKIDNLCCTCHQIRGVTTPGIYKNSADSIAKKLDPNFKQLPFFPLDNTRNLKDSIKYQVGQSFSVHDGNQSNVFAGINGFEYPGKTYNKTWKHSENTCIDCHMNEYAYDATTKTGTGGHTLIANEKKCEECHATSGTTDPIARTQAMITAKLTELGDLLAARKLFKKTTNATTGVVSYAAEPSHDYVGVLLPTTKTTATYGLKISSNLISPNTGLVVYAGTVQYSADTDYAYRIGRQWTYGELGAAYNYGFIGSPALGIHNPKYALDILQNSIDYLKSN